ncbi:MAG TPA: DEAD/DEAH box helicase, partial [Sorangium sp.]|nr:DEAD/DEAH box helicase [Sorangium sp.]
VKVPGRTVSPTVTLYLDDEEWDCDCDGQQDPCEHVSAAVIATRKARQLGRSLPTSNKAGGRVAYRLRADNDRVVVERYALTPAGKTPIKGSLATLLAGRADGPKVEPTKVDLSIDRLLTMKRLSSLPLDSFLSLLPLLADVEEVAVDDVPVRVDKRPLKPLATLRDAPHKKGFVLHFENNPSLRRLLVAGVALCDPCGHATTPAAPPHPIADASSKEHASSATPRLQLRPLGGMALSGRRLEKLPCERYYGPAQVVTLIGEVLPALADEAVLSIVTKRLPKRSRDLKPRVVVEVAQHGAALSVLPLLVYGDPPCARIDNGALVHLRGPLPIRDERAEARVSERLRAQLDLPLNHRRDFVGQQARAMAAKLRDYQNNPRHRVNGNAHRTLYPPKPLSASLSLGEGCFGVRFEAQGGDGAVTADTAAVMRAWQQGELLVPLMEGGWAELPHNWLAQHGHRLAELLAARNPEGQLARHALPVLAALCRDLDYPPPADLQKLRPLLEGFESLPPAALPSDLTATLRGYQQRGVDWLTFLRDAQLGAVLADDMGLGKTLQTLCVFRGRSLVVCPRSVVHNWAAEVARFRPSLRSHIYHGAQRKLDPDADVTLTTYAILRRDIDMLNEVAWDTAVLDEAQAIKNPDSQVAQAAYRLRAKFRVSLSGTPVENRLLELWSQMHFVNRGLLGGRGDFKARYEQPIAQGQPTAAQRLRQRIAPFLL